MVEKRQKGTRSRHLFTQSPEPGCILELWALTPWFKLLHQTSFPTQTPWLFCWSLETQTKGESKTGTTKLSPPAACLGRTPFLDRPPGGATSTTIHVGVKTQPSPFSKNNAAAIVQATGVWEAHAEKSRNFPSQEVPGRKSVPRSPATPQTREDEGHAGLYSPEGPSIREKGAGSWDCRSRLSTGAGLSGQALIRKAFHVASLRKGGGFFCPILIRNQPWTQLPTWKGLWVHTTCCLIPLNHCPVLWKLEPPPLARTVPRSPVLEWCHRTCGRLFLTPYIHNCWKSSFSLNYSKSYHMQLNSSKQN